jgi:hypothetical protein
MMSRLWPSRFWIRQLWPSHDLRPPILLSKNFVDIERVWLLVELTHSPTSEQLTAELDELLGYVLESASHDFLFPMFLS